jgi:hypothetical protein
MFVTGENCAVYNALFTRAYFRGARDGRVPGIIVPRSDRRPKAVASAPGREQQNGQMPF